MKLFFSIFFALLVIAKISYSEITNSDYVIKTKGLTIGLVSWTLEIDEKNYKTKIYLRSKGLLSALYKFEGFYESKGIISNKSYSPKKYIQKWDTKNKKRDIYIVFTDKKIASINIEPKEKELARIDYKEINNYVDPIASILNILDNKNSSKTIDGRRVYILEPSLLKNSIKVTIKDYLNIWADHKRNDLEFLEIYESQDSRLPKKINIGFKGSVFSLAKI
tara:strand:+ start:30 stop:692 length:663 start_codon:yes stop_codon:yes gene_type:complete